MLIGYNFALFRLGMHLVLHDVTLNPSIMKRSFLLLIALVALASCDVYVVDAERPYRSRDRIIGSHYNEEYSQTYREYYEYDVWISSGVRSNEVYIENLYTNGLSVYATVSFDAITIPYQIIDGYEIEGAGTIYSDQITLNYYVRDRYSNTVKDFCEATLWNDAYYSGRKAERERTMTRTKDIIF
jgi:hypothetical protein